MKCNDHIPDFEEELQEIQNFLRLPNLSYEEKVIYTNRMHQLQDVITKLHNNTYGLCDMCGQPIGSERLSRYPAVTTCVTCRSKQEKRAIYVSRNNFGTKPI